MKSSPTILIADSGSTKTAWHLAGPEPISFTTPGINPYYQDSQSITAGLENEPVFQKLKGLKISEIHFYGAGCSSLENQNSVKKALSVFFPDSEIHINHDMLGAARALCGHSPGIACILGTGSNSCLFDGKEIIADLPNLGFWLGDEGSAGHLGKTLVVKWFHKEMPEYLWQKFSQNYGLERNGFLHKIYHEEYPNRFLAGFAPFLSEHISDPWCSELVGQSFALFLSRFVLPYRQSDILPVHFLGSVALHFKDILQEEIKKSGLHCGQILSSAIEGLANFHAGN